MKMKRLSLIIISLIFVFGLVGCGSSKRENKTTTEQPTEQVTSEEETGVEPTEDTEIDITEEDITSTEEKTTEPTGKDEETYEELSDIENDIPDVDFTFMNEEDGVYYLINEIKSLGKSSGVYISGFGSTTYLLISAYIAANPESRWDASLKEVLGVATDMYSVEVELKKLNKKYEYTLEEMKEFDEAGQILKFDIISKYEETYSDDIWGWIDHQYDSLSGIGKRTMYYAKDENDMDCIVIPEEKFGDSGETTLRVAEVKRIQVEKDGFIEDMTVYYEISEELSAQIANDAGTYNEYEADLLEKQNEIYELLNQIN